MKPYKNHEEKAKWIVEHFGSVFNDIKSILDVGCDQRHLCKYLPERIKYIGIDICGAPDIYFNIENNEKLPFKDNSFDLVLCADILERLENIHVIFDKL
jgi:ubiquinone/menaquinone biosynthesis C-methylase UbiE